MLESSSILTDEELIEIVHRQSTTHRQAIARRESVSPSVSDAVIDSGDGDAVATLVENDGADISPGGLEKVVDKYGGMEGVLTLEDVVETLIGIEIVDEADNDVDMRKVAREKWGSRMESLGIDVGDIAETTGAARKTATEE